MDANQDGNEIYRPNEVQDIATSTLSELIADSYSWSANEAYWHTACNRDFGLAEDSDYNDPNRGDRPCREPPDPTGDGDSV